MVAEVEPLLRPKKVRFPVTPLTEAEALDASPSALTVATDGSSTVTEKLSPSRKAEGATVAGEFHGYARTVTGNLVQECEGIHHTGTHIVPV